MSNLVTGDAASTTAPTLSAADAAAHAAASYVRPRPHSFADAPATPAACRSDYEAGADVRATLTRQLRRG